MGTAAAGKDGREGVGEPIGEGDVADEVAIAGHLAHDVAVIDDHRIEVRRQMGEGIDPDLSAMPPRKVGDLSGVASVPDDPHESAQGLLRRIPPDHIVHLRVFLDDLLMEVRGGESAEDDGDIGMVLFDDLCQGQAPVTVGHPVQVDAEGPGVQGGDEALHVEPLVFEHLEGDVDDSHPEALPLQVFRDAGEAHGIHLEDGGGGDHIADRAQGDGTFAKIVYGGWVEED